MPPRGSSVPSRVLPDRVLPGRLLSDWRAVVVLILVAVTLGAAAGGLWGWHGEGRHRATAVILVNPLEGSPFSPEGQGDDLVNLETEAQLVTSDSVTGMVATRLGRTDPIETIRAGVGVSVPTNTQLLKIRAVNRSATQATRRAQAFAETYLAFRKARTESLLFDRNTRINAQLKQLGVQLEQSSRQLSRAAPRSPQGLLLQQQVTELTNRIGTLHTQLVASQSASTDPGQVVTPAAADPPGLIAGPMRSGVVGAVGALLVCLFLLFARGRLDFAVQDPGELEPLGVPVLANDDQLGRVRARLLAIADRTPLAVMVATTTPTVRRASTALGLGSAFGRAGLETILVEAVEFVPGVEQRAGLSDLVLDRLTVDEALAPLMTHLQLLTCGTDRDLLDDVVAGPEMSVLLTDLLKRADVVVVAAGPIDDVRTQAMARLCDLTVLEVAEGRSSLSDLETSLETLQQCGGSLAGLVYVPAADGRRSTRRARRE